MKISLNLSVGKPKLKSMAFDKTNQQIILNDGRQVYLVKASNDTDMIFKGNIRL